MTTLLFICGYYLMAMLFFMLIQRPLFILSTSRSNPSGRLTGKDLLRIAGYGVRSDAVGAVYLSLLPALTAIATSFIPGAPFRLTFTVVNLLTALVAGAAAASDPLLYRFWKSKIDASALRYLKSIRGVTASVSTGFIFGSILLWLLLSAVFYAGARLVAQLTVISHPFIASGIAGIAATAIGGLLLMGIFFLIIRGAGHRPKTPSVSFFSTNVYLNHCAVNPDYNFIYSLNSSGDLANKFRFMTDDECCDSAHAYYPTSGSPECNLLKTPRANILFIIWESLSWRHAGGKSGDVEILPNFNRLATDGVLFTRMDAGNIRTDRGLVCLLSGYLSPPAEAIIKYTRKLPLLPSLPRSLSKEGYSTSAWHGGDLAFFHMKDYYMAAGFDHLTDLSAFERELCRCKWGVHDEILFRCVADDIDKATKNGERWFITLQTLSSHEPFDVPRSIIPCDKIANSFAYTDQCLGELTDRLKKSGAWDDTLIVITGDHGFYHGDAIDRDKYPHIPLLLTGGAVADPAVIDTVMSQTDIAATLLGQLGIDHSDYPFSRDVLADSYRDQFSFHSHQTGFMVRDNRGVTEFDLASRRAIAGDDPERCRRGLVSLQQLHTTLSKI